MMSENFTSPTMISRRKTKEHAKKMEHGSPKFTEVLRQRCRDRMRVKRNQLFQRHRSFKDSDPEVQGTLGDIVHEEYLNVVREMQEMEIDNVDENCMSLEEVLQMESEIIAENEHWIIQEFDRQVLEFEEKMFCEMSEDATGVYCPFCQRVYLQNYFNSIKCRNCDFEFPARVSLEVLKNLLETASNHHSSHCFETPRFIITPETTSLYMVCSKCNDMIHII